MVVQYLSYVPLYPNTALFFFVLAWSYSTFHTYPCSIRTLHKAPHKLVLGLGHSWCIIPTVFLHHHSSGEAASRWGVFQQAVLTIYTFPHECHCEQMGVEGAKPPGRLRRRPAWASSPHTARPPALPVLRTVTAMCIAGPRASKIREIICTRYCVYYHARSGILYVPQGLNMGFSTAHTTLLVRGFYIRDFLFGTICR
jgi:hypothetical protein